VNRFEGDPRGGVAGVLLNRGTGCFGLLDPGERGREPIRRFDVAQVVDVSAGGGIAVYAQLYLSGG
jgi:hypothetical protein